MCKEAQCVAQFAPLVKRLAHCMMATLPASVDVNDLIQAGMIGLLEALRHYQRGTAEFTTFAYKRIRGAMIDELRKGDWMSRSIRQSLRRADALAVKFEHVHNRVPTGQELADALNIPLAEYRVLIMPLTYDEEDQQPGPLQQLIEKSERQHRLALFGALPEREQQVMMLRYEQGLNLKETGEIMGLSESRVSQIHTAAINLLRLSVEHGDNQGVT